MAVVNAAPSISGRFPNLGPQILVDAGIPLVDAVGAEVLHAVKDGVRVRVHEGVLYAGEQVLAEGVAQTADSVADALVEAKSGLAHQLEAFAANTIEFMRRERGMLLDGVGVPDVQVDLADRQVLVVAAGYDHVADLARLRRFVREHRPRLIGVGAGADALLAAGHRPDLIVGNPAEVSEEALTCGADVVVPAFTDGHAPGLHRVQDLGAGAVTFPSSANAEDLALLLAHHHGASMIITVGVSASMGEFLDRGRSGSNASTFLTRLQTGGTVVDARVVAALHRNRISGWLVALLLVAAATAVVAALSGVGGGGRGAGVGAAGRDGRRRARPGRCDVISLRYHVVSIAAVFLALAMGVVLGASGVSDRVLVGRVEPAGRPGRAGDPAVRGAGHAGRAGPGGRRVRLPGGARRGPRAAGRADGRAGGRGCRRAGPGRRHRA